jgi:hypothetical protein
MDYDVYGLMSGSGSCESSLPRTISEMKESPKTAGWVPQGVVMGCKSMLKIKVADRWRLAADGCRLADRWRLS